MRYRMNAPTMMVAKHRDHRLVGDRRMRPDVHRLHRPCLPSQTTPSSSLAMAIISSSGISVRHPSLSRSTRLEYSAMKR